MRREFFPSVVDIVAEIDSGHGKVSELLSYQNRRQSKSNDSYDLRKRSSGTDTDEEIHLGIGSSSGPSSSSGSGTRTRSGTGMVSMPYTPDTPKTTDSVISSDTDSVTPLPADESFLKYSKVLLGPGAKQIYPLDWTSLSGLFNSLQPQEKVSLGVQVSQCVTRIFKR